MRHTMLVFLVALIPMQETLRSLNVAKMMVKNANVNDVWQLKAKPSWKYDEDS
jgi:hypothetical protein